MRSPARTHTAALACVLGIALGSASTAGARASTSPPPLGRYTCYQYSYPSGYLYFGFFTLSSGSTYNAGKAGSGRYAYSPSTRWVTWLSGPYQRYHWKGRYFPKGMAHHTSNTIVVTGPQSISIDCWAGKH